MKYLLLLVGSLIMSSVQGGEYAIQVKSDKARLKDYYDTLSIYGNVYTVKDADGNDSTYIGPFHSHQNVIDALHEIHVAGFDDTYIVKQDSVNESKHHHLATRYNVRQYDVNNILEGESLKRWNQLSVTEKANIQYHQGVLKIKDGDTLIPLDTYLANKK